VVEVTFDPAQVSYADILKVFWENHDPTQLNRQGPDYGKQYRTAIFFHSPEQEAAARASKEALGKSGTYKRKIVTEITPASEFWRAEDYHQQYPTAQRGGKRTRREVSPSSESKERILCFGNKTSTGENFFGAM
jgi:peptide-methionine (S)-S-oxide reductase